MGEPVARVGRRIWNGGATFNALRDASFRWFWIGRVASSASLNMLRVAQGWLVYDLTRSALSLSWVNSGRSLLILALSLYGGAISDRFDKRTIIMVARAGYVVTSLAVAALIMADVIELWHLVAYSLFSGLLSSFMMPAQQALLPELVDRKTLLNAVSLNSIGLGLTGIFAASLSGYMVDEIGPQAVYLFMAALYGINVYAISRLPVTGGSGRSKKSPLLDVKEVIGYLRQQPVLLVLLGLTLSRALFYMPYRTYLPKYAKEVLGFGATGLGILTSAPSVGSLVGALVMASLGDYKGKGKLVVLAGLAVAALLIFWANVSWFPLVLIGMTLTGFAGNVVMVANSTLLQTNSEPRFCGRVMSAYMMVWGMTPFSTIPLGALADRIGVQAIITIMGAMLLVAFATAFLLAPQVRQLE